jgi:signal transduction histidine kinase
VREFDKFLVIDVADTGVGIPEEDMHKLFKLFGFIENKNSAMNKNGIGLGLTIVKSIVEQFSGTITCKSIPEPNANHGSVFTFSFKLQNNNQHSFGDESEDHSLNNNLKQVNVTSPFFGWQPSSQKVISH